MAPGNRAVDDIMDVYRQQAERPCAECGQSEQRAKDYKRDAEVAERRLAQLNDNARKRYITLGHLFISACFAAAAAYFGGCNLNTTVAVLAGVSGVFYIGWAIIPKIP